MIDSINADYVANEVSLLRAAFKGPIVLVEGDSDQLFFERIFEQESVNVQSAYCRDYALDALRLVQGRGFRGVIAIVDADFGHLDGSSPPADVFFTDTHDLETMLLQSNALDKVLRELGDKKLISGFEKSIKKSVRQHLLDNGKFIGYLLWLSIKSGLSLCFKDLEFQSFVCNKSLTVDVKLLIKEVDRNTRRGVIDQSGVLSKLQALMNKERDLWQVCCGHHLVHLLAMLLKSRLSAKNISEITPVHLERILRLAYEKSYFPQTNLYQQLRGWEERNASLVLMCIVSAPSP